MPIVKAFVFPKNLDSKLVAIFLPFDSDVRLVKRPWVTTIFRAILDYRYF